MRAFGLWHFRFAVRVFSFIGLVIFLLVLVFRRGNENNFQNLPESDKEALVLSAIKTKADSSADFWEVSTDLPDYLL